MSAFNNERHLLMSVWEYDLFHKAVGDTNQLLDGERSLWEDAEAKIFSVRSVKPSIIASLESTSNTEEDACCRRSSRNHQAKSRSQTARALYHELCRFDCDPYLLITPFCFGAEGGVASSLMQPFRVSVHPQCPLVCEIHSHLSDAEVIGLLAGRWDPESNVLYVQLPFPCMSTSTFENNGSTDVEMDPEAEYKARQQAEEMGLQIIGWYHSHPRFKPNPSVIDVFNQQQYQSVMKDQPFLGLVISPYDKDCVDGSALHQWFVVKRYDEDLSTGEIFMPVKVDIEVQGFQHDISTVYLQEDELDANLQRYNPDRPITVDIKEENSPEQVVVNVDDINKINEDSARPTKKQRKASSKTLGIVDLSVDVNPTQKNEVAVMSSSSFLNLSASQPATSNDSVISALSSPVATNIIQSPSSLELLRSPSMEEGFGRRSGRAKKPSAAILLMEEQKDHVFNERLPSKTEKMKAMLVAAKKEKKASEEMIVSSPKIESPLKSQKKDKKINDSESTKSKKRKVDKEETNLSSANLEKEESNMMKNSSKPGLEVTTTSGPTIYNNLVLSLLHPTLPSAKKGCRLLLTTPVELKYVTSLCIAMGFYYSRFKRRVELSTPWKGKTKADKLKEASLYWLSFFQPPSVMNQSAASASSRSELQQTVPSPTLQQFAECMVSFFSECWNDYSASTGKVKKLCGTKKNDT